MKRIGTFLKGFEFSPSGNLSIIVAPLLGLAYIIVMPFLAIAAVLVLGGLLASKRFIPLWRR